MIQKGSENALSKPHKTNSRIDEVRLFHEVWVLILVFEN
jgi:hypothetical protein